MQELERTSQVPNDLTCFSLSEMNVFLYAGQKGTTIHFFKYKIKPEKRGKEQLLGHCSNFMIIYVSHQCIVTNKRNNT
jgi:hypothetical protein